MFKRICAVGLSLIIVIMSGLLQTVSADNNEAKGQSNAINENTGEYKFSGIEYAECINAETIDDSAVLLKQSASSVTYAVDLPEKGSFYLSVNYALISDNTGNTEFALRINNDFPFDGADELALRRFWRDADSGIKTDALGNEYAPTQEIYKDYVERIVRDENDADCKEYIFELNKGVNYITLSDFSDDAKIKSLTLKSADSALSYEQYLKQWEMAETDGEYKIYEGEAAFVKSTRSLVPKSDSASATITPADAVKQKINYIGGTGWTSAGEELVWSIDVPADGFYKIACCFKQDQKINSTSYRNLKIDNQTPFDECKSIGFDYGTNWQNSILGNENEDYIFFLEKGKHTISMTATLGETADYYNRLKDALTEIGDLYVDITMITGESPDANRDYELFNVIPDYDNRLNSIKDELGKIADGAKKLNNNETNSFITSIADMERILTSMLENKYDAQNYITNYSTSYTTLCNTLYDMRTTPLSLDKFYIIPKDCDFKYETAGFFEKMLFGIKRFITAFSSDYGNISEETGGKQLRIWVNWGRDQATVLNTLISESFTPETGISVNLEVTNASVINGMLSGNAPDLCLHMARTEPVNLALRGALVDLSEFDDYDEVIKRFGESASTPYKYENGVYALPDQQSFYIMFYRKDILANLGIEVPETWDEFLEAVAVLQLNNMDAWIPYTQIASATTVNTGVGGLNMYASILQQFGGKFFNDELNECVVNNEVGLKAFTYWTDMYTKNKLPTTASFYNRFRIGTMPLGIEAYTQYTTIATAAPDIEGRWGISLVPGIEDENGNINHTVAGSGTGCAILKTSELQDEAWEFLKWWTRADTQLMYNNNVESIIGTISRTTTATLEAFSEMDWEEDDLQILLQQREWIEEIPEVPGSYYVSRSIDQAFWNVINNNGRVKDILDKQTAISTMEIQRKIDEYANKK